MTRLLVAFLLTALTFIHLATAQPPTDRIYLRVLVPRADARLFIDDHLTKQRGEVRDFQSPVIDPRKTYRYTITARWWPNNYTEVIRTRVVEVRAGKEIEVDLRKKDDKNPDKYHIRYVPTPDEVVEAMCKLGEVGKDDVVYDLGCGDGRIVITAITKFKAKRGVGVDIDKALVEESRDNAREAKVEGKVEFRHQDVLTIKDLSEATVVMMYMGEDVNLRLMPILKQTLKPGARIVSHDFKMGDWKAEKMIPVTDNDGIEHELYLWRIGK